MSYSPAKHHRRSIRLKGYDYSQEGIYFITFCCYNRKHLFGRIENGKMILNEFGKIAFDEWMKTPLLRPNIELGEFVVMPNHIHGIVIIENSIQGGSGGQGDPGIPGGPVDQGSPGVLQYAPTTTPTTPTIPTIPTHPTTSTKFSPNFKSPSQTIGAIVRGYKGSVTKQIKELRFRIPGECNSDSKIGESGYKNKRGDCKSPQNMIQKVWERNYYEHIVRDQRAFDNISRYILNNPLNWKGDKFSGTQ